MQPLRMVLQPCEQELQPPTQGVNRAEPRVAERGWRYPVDVTDAPAPTPPVANARRRVPRWVWFVVVCVALGAMTSVGVAWGIAWRGDPIRSEHERYSILPIPTSQVASGKWPLCWGISERSGIGQCVLRVETLDARWPEDAMVDRLDDSAGLDVDVRAGVLRHTPLLKTPEAPRVSFWIVRSGYPMHCLSQENACTPRTASSRPHTAFANRAKLVNWGDRPPGPITNPAFNLLPHYNAIEIRQHLLPTFPLWPGLLANTAIYGGAWAVLIGTPILLRRWLRAHRGGCPACGYSREGLKEGAPCPECGRTTPAAHDATPTSTAR